MRNDAKDGGAVAGRTRKAIETQSKRKVITSENYLDKTKRQKDMIDKSKSSNIPEKMDRKKAVLTTFEKHDRQDILDMARMPYEEKSRLITFLREAQYGAKATTGRLSRFYRIVKLK